ncbi:MAG: hypothetical protein IAE80_21890 [Anaerolinea sp.]|nr:hypothetical protein [Anaerolinea sp.]
MTTASLREQLIARIDRMTDDDVRSLIKLIDLVESSDSDELPPDYSEENDPLIGFLSGTTDLAEHVKETLYSDIDEISGWTQKKA